MLKTNRIIPLVFILFLFGFTFSTVSPVFAQDPMLEGRDNRQERRQGVRDKDPFTYAPDGNPRQSPDGKFHCVGFPEIRENPDEPKGVAYAKCKQKFNASPSPSQQVAPTPSVAPTAPSGGEVAKLNAKISGLEAGLTELKGVVRALQEQSKNSMQPVAPTARKKSRGKAYREPALFSKHQMEEILWEVQRLEVCFLGGHKRVWQKGAKFGAQLTTKRCDKL